MCALFSSCPYPQVEVMCSAIVFIVCVYIYTLLILSLIVVNTASMAHERNMEQTGAYPGLHTTDNTADQPQSDNGSGSFVHGTTLNYPNNAHPPASSQTSGPSTSCGHSNVPAGCSVVEGYQGSVESSSGVKLMEVNG